MNPGATRNPEHHRKLTMTKPPTLPISGNTQRAARWTATYTRTRAADGTVTSTQRQAVDAVCDAAHRDARILPNPPAFEIRTCRLSSTRNGDKDSGHQTESAAFSIELRHYPRVAPRTVDLRRTGAEPPTDAQPPGAVR